MATLGKLTDGAGNSSSTANKTVVSQFTADVDGTVTAGHARLWVTAGTADVEMVVYADSGGAVGALLGLSDTETISNTTEAEIDFTFTGAEQAAIVNGTPYWVGFTWADPGTNSVTWSRDSTASQASQNSSHAADPFGAATTLSGPIDAYLDVAEPLTGVAFLTDDLGADGRLTVEVAFGADLTDLDGSGWTWTDLTTDVRADPGVSWRLGRGDESSRSNPAELTLVLTNTSGDYSLGGRSQHYPYVRRNTPIRVTIDPGDGDGARTAYLGFATGWSPGWDALTGTVPVVTLTASGTLRRLDQGADPVISPISRYLLNAADVTAYWPCEVGEHATSIPPAFGGGSITWAGTADLASSTDFPASRPLPTTNSDALYRAIVTPYTVATNNTQSVRMMFKLPPVASAPADGAVLVSIIPTGGTISRMDLVYGTGEVLRFKAYNAAGTEIISDDATFGIDGDPGMLSLEFAHNAGTTFLAVKFLGLGSENYGESAGDSAAGTFGIVSEVWIDPYQEVDGLAFGHIAVMTTGSAASPLDDGVLQVNAYDGEPITGVGSGRLQRVCDENSIDLTFYSGDPDDPTFNDDAGPQAIATVLEILHACADVERGVLWDGLDAGLAYTTRRRHENAAAALTIDAGADELAAPFAPIDDDQRTRNRWTVTRTGGAEFTVEDTDGPMGTAAVQVYPDSLTINSEVDRAARDLADWLVHAGTVEGYRYPTVTLDLRATPHLAGAVVDLIVGSRVDITNLDDALASAPGETVSLTVEGIAHNLTPRSWTVTLSCSPFEVWRVDVLAEDSGDTGEFLWRLDADTSTLGADYAAGATSISVATAAPGALWTTDSDDYPLALDVGGVRVRATACSGSSSPQTFTVDALPVARSSGAAVKVWNPPVLGL